MKPDELATLQDVLSKVESTGKFAFEAAKRQVLITGRLDAVIAVICFLMAGAILGLTLALLHNDDWDLEAHHVLPFMICLFLFAPAFILGYSAIATMLNPDWAAISLLLALRK